MEVKEDSSGIPSMIHNMAKSGKARSEPLVTTFPGTQVLRRPKIIKNVAEPVEGFTPRGLGVKLTVKRSWLFSAIPLLASIATKIRKESLMQEIKAGDTVLLHLPDGSATPRVVINVISPTVVQLFKPGINSSPFVSTTAPLYQRGPQPGQWEPADEVQGEEFKILREFLQMATNPRVRELHSLLNVKLPADLEAVFSLVEQVYADKDASSPFHDVQDRDYFYNLLMMGVQEGLRSAFYFLQHFLYLEEIIKESAVAMMPKLNPSRAGTLGISASALTAEYEGFILLSRATLDRLTYLLKYYFHIKNKNPNLYDLRRNLEEDYKDNNRAQRLVQTMKKHSAYLDTQFIGKDQPTERNRLAHQE